MKNFFGSRKAKRFIITMAVIIAVCIVSNIDNTLISSLVNAATNSMQGLSAYAANSAVPKSYDEMSSEYEKLKKENAELRAQLVDYIDVKQENAKLKKYYGLVQNNPEYKTMPASVIRRDPNDEFYSFTIDRGKASGIEVNDAVVTEQGLVGWVTQVDLSTAKVSTILSVDAKVGSLDKTSTDSGVITGRFELAKDNLTSFSKISASNKIKVGDFIVTSGISGLYPPNIIVGEVKELKIDGYDTSAYAIIEPFENIKSVQDVLVIIDFKGKNLVLNEDDSKENAESIANVTTVPITTVTDTTVEE